MPAIQVDTGGIIVIKRGEISLRDIYLTGKDVNQFMMCIGAQVLVNGADAAALRHQRDSVVDDQGDRGLRRPRHDSARVADAEVRVWHGCHLDEMRGHAP